MALTATTTHAGSYPDRPIRLAVGFGVGGPTDIPARFIADKLSQSLGQRVLVENKPASGGIVATRDVIARPADGCSAARCMEASPDHIDRSGQLAGRPSLAFMICHLCERAMVAASHPRS